MLELPDNIRKVLPDKVRTFTYLDFNAASVCKNHVYFYKCSVASGGYVGSTTTGWRRHRVYRKGINKSQRLLHNHVGKYGINNYTITVIYFPDNTVEYDLREWEMYFIKVFGTYSKDFPGFGLNLINKAFVSPSTFPEVAMRISRSNKGRKRPDLIGKVNQEAIRKGLETRRKNDPDNVKLKAHLNRIRPSEFTSEQREMLAIFKGSRPFVIRDILTKDNVYHGFSISQAAERLNIHHPGYIRKCLAGKIKYFKGYTAHYMDIKNEELLEKAIIFCALVAYNRGKADNELNIERSAEEIEEFVKVRIKDAERLIKKDIRKL